MFLTLVCGEGSCVDLRELWEPIKDHFTGLCAVCHAAPDSEEAKYLEANKKEGRIIYLPYVGRHDLSRQTCVHCGAIQENDIVFQSDVLERPNPQFVAGIREHGWYISLEQFNALFFHGKILLYRYHESISFEGTPHEGFRRLDGQLRAVDIKSAYPDENDVRGNVRPQKRPVHHYIMHYMRYLVEIPWGGNHMLLGLEKNGSPATLFPIRESRRVAFREYCREIGLPLKAESIREYMENMKERLPEIFKQFVRNEKILNDCYRWYILGRRDIVDDHDHKNLVDIP